MPVLRPSISNHKHKLKKSFLKVTSPPPKLTSSGRRKGSDLEHSILWRWDWEFHDVYRSICTHKRCPIFCPPWVSYVSSFVSIWGKNYHVVKRLNCIIIHSKQLSACPWFKLQGVYPQSLSHHILSLPLLRCMQYHTTMDPIIMGLQCMTTYTPQNIKNILWGILHIYTDGQLLKISIYTGEYLMFYCSALIMVFSELR